MAALSDSNITDHYQLDIHLKFLKCISRETTSEDLKEPVKDSSSLPSIVESFLGHRLYSMLQQTVHSAITGTVHDEQEMEQCELQKEYHQVFTMCPQTVLIWSYIIVLLLIVCVALPVIAFIFMRYGKSKKDLNKVKVTGDTVSTHQEFSTKLTNTDDGASLLKTSSSTSVKQLNVSRDVIRLSYQSFLESANPGKYEELGEFLQNTTDKLFAEIDKLLLTDGEDTIAITPVMNSATPRLPRRPIARRPRMGSSPNLPGVSLATGSSVSPDKSSAWEDLLRFSADLGLKEHLQCMFEDRSGKRRPFERLGQFHLRVCPILTDHWRAATLVVNYVLCLMNKELRHVVLPSGYRFIKFIATGSGRMGTKVAKPNQFDFLFVLQTGDIMVTEAVDQAIDETVPPGKLLLSTGKLPVNSSFKSYERLMKKLGEGSDERYCLSSKEFRRSAEELVDSCLKSIYTKTRSLMDRLPFSIQRASTPDLLLTLDTKMLVGLGVLDIKVRLIPCLPLPVNGWYQAVQLYAMPPVLLHEYKHRAGSQSIAEPDHIWQICLDDFSLSFHSNILHKMEMAGVHSCHIACLQILKSLFTAGPKNNLLDRGEIQSFHLQTVINFLLLESSPLQWTYDKLADRFSDCIHFLRSAFSNGRLPNFFICNPHLLNKMPCLSQFPMLCRGRQENLLLDMSVESLEKCVHFMEDSLKEAGLQDCVKGEYSDDMWEYEFFLFN